MPLLLRAAQGIVLLLQLGQGRCYSLLQLQHWLIEAVCLQLRLVRCREQLAQTQHLTAAADDGDLELGDFRLIAAAAVVAGRDCLAYEFNC
jgi:hypothetical protein